MKTPGAILAIVIATLSKAAIWPATAMVLAIIGAVTYLASNGNLSGSDVLTVVVLILGGVLGVTSAHVAGTAVGNAVNQAPPGSVVLPASTAPAPEEPPVIAPQSAMPAGGG